jgi:hypothetical protein
MTFALATLAFLAAAWLAMVVLAGTLKDYGARVRTALAGTNAAPVAQPAMTVCLSPRYPTRLPVRLRPSPALRAAA